jgi:hypothetical protein
MRHTKSKNYQNPPICQVFERPNLNHSGSLFPHDHVGLNKQSSCGERKTQGSKYYRNSNYRHTEMALCALVENSWNSLFKKTQ